MNHIGIITPADIPELIACRKAVYGTATDFNAADGLDGIGWDKNDDRSCVLGAWSDGFGIAATMRGTMIHEPAEFRGQSAASVPRELSYPVLIMRKAATISEFQRSGLNSILRYYFIKAAQTFKIRYLVGNVIENASRVKLMRELGYRISKAGVTDLGGLKTADSRTWRLAVLDVQIDGQHALELLEQRFASEISKYPWTGQPIRF